MNNEEYFELLNNEKKTLDELRKQGVELAQGVIGKTLLGAFTQGFVEKQILSDAFKRKA